MHDKKYQAEEASSSSTSGKYKMREQLGQFLWESVFAISSLTSWGNKTMLQPLQLLSSMAQIGVEIPLSWQRSKKRLIFSGTFFSKRLRLGSRVSIFFSAFACFFSRPDVSC